jgi:hypothetical protein
VKADIAKLVTFGRGGDTVYFGAGCTSSGYGSPDRPHAAESRDGLIFPDGCPVIDKRAAVDTPEGYHYVFSGPMVNVDLPDGHIDACPLLDRCVQIKLSNQGLTPLFAARLREIAQAENCDGEPEAYYVKVMKEVGHSSLRAGLAWLESRILAKAAR